MEFDGWVCCFLHKNQRFLITEWLVIGFHPNKPHQTLISINLLPSLIKETIQFHLFHSTPWNKLRIELEVIDLWRELSWFVWWNGAGVHLAIPFNQNQPMNATNGAANLFSFFNQQSNSLHQQIKSNVFDLNEVDGWLLLMKEKREFAERPGRPAGCLLHSQINSFHFFICSFSKFVGRQQAAIKNQINFINFICWFAFCGANGPHSLHLKEK